MKRFAVTLSIIFSAIASQSQDVCSVVTDVVNKIKHCETISHFSRQKWGDLADIPNFTFNNGYCIFKLMPADSIIGGYFNLKPTGLSQIYSGRYLSRIERKDSTMTVTDLVQYPDQKRYIETPMLYTNSVLDLYNLMKHQLEYAPDKMRLLSDTVVNKRKCKQVLVVLADTMVKNQQLYFYKKIAIDAETLLPLHCVSVSQSQYGKQIIECTLTRYKLNDRSINRHTFTDDNTPDYVRRIQYTPEKANAAIRLEVNSPAPAFTLPDVNGGSFSLAESKGKVILLEFSGVHCMFCLRAVEDLNAVHHYFDPEKVQIVSVYSDEMIDRMKMYAAKYKVSYTLLCNYRDGKVGEKLLSQYGVGGIPHFFLINQSGTVVWNAVGYSPGIGGEIKYKVQQLLEQSR